MGSLHPDYSHRGQVQIASAKTKETSHNLRRRYSPSWDKVEIPVVLDSRNKEVVSAIDLVSMTKGIPEELKSNPNRFFPTGEEVLK